MLLFADGIMMHKSGEPFQRSIISEQLGEGYDIRMCADEIRAGGVTWKIFCQVKK
jgi:hypothetical protein